MHVLLDSKAPGFAEKIISLPFSQWRDILVRACLTIGNQTPELNPSTLELLEKLRVQKFLSAADIKRANSEAQTADGKYLQLQSGGGGNADVLKWFSEARLLTAIAVGFEGSSSNCGPEAIYELTKASDNPSEFIRIVRNEVESSTQK